MEKTQRKFTNVENKHVLELWQDLADNYHLIYGKPASPELPSEGSEVNGFFICSHTGLVIKLNGKKEIKLSPGEFYNFKEGEKVTHKKYVGFQKFTKL